MSISFSCSGTWYDLWPVCLAVYAGGGMRCWIMLVSAIRCPCCGARVKRKLLSTLQGCISADCGDGFDGAA